MNTSENKYNPDKKHRVREVDHMTRPARLEGGVKEAMMQPKKKQKASDGK